MYYLRMDEIFYYMGCLLSTFSLDNAMSVAVLDNKGNSMTKQMFRLIVLSLLIEAQCRIGHVCLLNFPLSKKRRIPFALHTRKLSHHLEDRAILTRLSPSISLGTGLKGNYGNTPGFGIP